MKSKCKTWKRTVVLENSWKLKVEMKNELKEEGKIKEWGGKKEITVKWPNNWWMKWKRKEGRKRKDAVKEKWLKSERISEEWNHRGRKDHSQ